jgi:Zn-dependent M28 family amino/carboxypeptidase
MLHSSAAVPLEPLTEVLTALSFITASQLRVWVQQIAYPRHYRAERERNHLTADWLFRTLEGFGLHVERAGEYANIVARPKTDLSEAVLVGAHYDSVPMSPGADDNGSAVAAMLGCAAMCARWSQSLPIVFVGFNREEDDLLGSKDFVESHLPNAPFRVAGAHILEMVGYARSEPGTQRVPTGLPIELSDRGNFLGLLANTRSGLLLNRVLRSARTYAPTLVATGLEVGLGVEMILPVLARSDHVPFWAHGIPAVMWTDTAEFRNPHYHATTDTPQTLNYEFLTAVTRLLTASVITHWNDPM